MKCTSPDLLERLKQRGARHPDFTRKLIVDKLNDTDLEVNKGSVVRGIDSACGDDRSSGDRVLPGYWVVVFEAHWLGSFAKIVFNTF
jgi:hypothetical protein